jgi:Major Facilitator Superfamily
LVAPIVVAALAATARLLPDDRGQRVALHWPGALSLTLGAALLMTAATAVPQHAIPAWGGCRARGRRCHQRGWIRKGFAPGRAAADPAQLIIETRFLPSAVAAFAQMFALATVIVAVPLYVTGTLGRSTATTGALVFALPVAMVLGATVVGAVSDRIGPRPVLRAGLIALTFAVLALGFYSDRGGHSLAVLSALLIAIGVGVALVQTPSATGATRSPAGRSGAVLGLFNMLRFGASAFGTAWVAIVYPRGALLVLFGGRHFSSPSV